MATDWLIADGDIDTRDLAAVLTNFPDSTSHWVTGYDGNNAIQLDGVDDFVDVTGPYLAGKTSLSMTAWVSQPIDNAWVGIVTSRETIAGTSECAEIGLYGGEYGGPGGLGYDWSWASGDPWKFDAGLDVPTDNTWTFVALVVDPTGATLYMRPLGGTLGSGRNAIVHPPLKTFSQYFDISLSKPPASGFHKGGIDDVRIYDYNLTLSEVNYLCGLSGTDPNPWPVYWYKLDESSGLTAANSGIGVAFYQGVPSIANLTDPEPQYSRSVNLRDYALLGKEWLQTKLYP